MAVNVSVKVIDQYNNPLSNHTIIFTAVGFKSSVNSNISRPSSSYSPTKTETTNSSGIANVTFPSDTGGELVEYTFYDDTASGKTATATINQYERVDTDGIKYAKTETYQITIKSDTTYYYVVRTEINGSAVPNMTISYGSQTAQTTNSLLSYCKAYLTGTTSSAKIYAYGTYNNKNYTGSATVKGLTSLNWSSATTITLTTNSELYKYSITVQDQLGRAVSDAQVQISGGTLAYVTPATTNSDGVATFNLDFSSSQFITRPPTNYTVTKSGYVTVSGKLTTPSKKDGSFVSLYYISNTTATTDTAITIYGNCYDATTTKPLEGVNFNMTDTGGTTTVLATTNDYGYYSAEIMIDPSYQSYSFTKDGYVMETNTLFNSDKPRFTEDLKWDQILWQTSLPANVDDSMAYKEWLIANRNKYYENLSESNFQMAKRESIEKCVPSTTPNDKKNNQMISKKEIVNTNGYIFTLHDYGLGYKSCPFAHSLSRTGVSDDATFKFNGTQTVTLSKAYAPFGFNLKYGLKDSFGIYNIYAERIGSSVNAKKMANFVAGIARRFGMYLSESEISSMQSRITKNKGKSSPTSLITIWSETIAISIKTTLTNMFPDSSFIFSGDSVTEDSYKTDYSTPATSTIKSVFSGCKWGEETNPIGLFKSCHSMETLDMPNTFLDVNSIENLAVDCDSLETVNLDCREMRRNATGMKAQNAFLNCTSLKKVSLKNLFSTPPDFECLTGMFNNCQSLEDIYLYGFDASNLNIDSNQMFNNCYSLKHIYLDNNEYVNDIISLIESNINFNCEIMEGDNNSISINTYTDDTLYDFTVTVRDRNSEYYGGEYPQYSNVSGVDFSIYTKFTDSDGNSTLFRRAKSHGAASVTIRVKQDDILCIGVDALNNEDNYTLANGSEYQLPELASLYTITNRNLNIIIPLIHR